MLGRITMRSQEVVSESGKAARMLSRLLHCEPVLPISAEASAGLALLSLVPRVEGQPEPGFPGLGPSWVHWVFGWVVTGLCIVGTWWWLRASSSLGDRRLPKSDGANREIEGDALSENPVELGKLGLIW